MKFVGGMVLFFVFMFVYCVSCYCLQMTLIMICYDLGNALFCHTRCRLREDFTHRMLQTTPIPRGVETEWLSGCRLPESAFRDAHEELVDELLNQLDNLQEEPRTFGGARVDNGRDIAWLLSQAVDAYTRQLRRSSLNHVFEHDIFFSLYV